MIVDATSEDIEKLYVDFLNEKKYDKRIIFFDEHFGLIPPELTFFDSRLSWFYNGARTLELINALLKENDPVAGHFTREFFLKNRGVSFSIRPVNRSQREQLNKWVVNAFIRDCDAMGQFIEKDLEGVEDRVAYLKARLTETKEQIGRVGKKLEEVSNTALKFRFLAIFYSGYSSFYENDRTFMVKRRMVELYLYCQGLLFSNYQEALRGMLEDAKRTQVAENTASPDCQLLLLDKLGVLRYLESLCTHNSIRPQKESVARLLSFLLKGNASLYSAVLAYLESDEPAGRLLNLPDDHYRDFLEQLRDFQIP